MPASKNQRRVNRLHEDFRTFLVAVWHELGLPKPTRVQLDIAKYLQHGPTRKVIEAYRGCGKSWISAAFVCWLAYRNKNVRILVVSASKERADQFSIFVKRLLHEIGWLQHLEPDIRQGDRASNISFDFRGAAAAQAPSVKSIGITGQLTGSRADFIILDDVEVVNNSETASQREKLRARVAEAGGAILTLDDGAERGVIFLGTPQVEDSIYTKLPESGYDVRIWPAEVPADKDKYAGRLAPLIAEMDDAPGTPTDPERFAEQELAERKLEYGRLGYTLQWLLDTSLSDEDRHPLKLSDLIITNTNVDVAPDRVVWGSDDKQIMEHLPLAGLPGDKFRRPVKVSDEWSPYGGSVMYIDPSGRGRDETGYAVVKILHGQLILRAWGGLAGGYEEPTLAQLATKARDERVNLVLVEDNFGDGMYVELFKPVLRRVWGGEGCRVEGDRAVGAKEARIIGSLEPVVSGHRLIVDEAVVLADLKDKSASSDVDAALKSGFYQLTRITAHKGALKYDDRIDALAGAVRYWTAQMSADVGERAQAAQDERLQEELDKFVESVLKQKGSGVGLGSYADDGLGWGQYEQLE